MSWESALEYADEMCAEILREVRRPPAPSTWAALTSAQKLERARAQRKEKHMRQADAVRRERGGA